MTLNGKFLAGCVALSFSLGLAACAPAAEPTTSAPAEQPTAEMAQPTAAMSTEASTMPKVSGELPIDGSSTVYPITEAIAEDFIAANPDARVTVAFSGTGGGFKKFCNKETKLSDASRPIKDEETAACAASGIEPIPFEVAYDGLAVVANKANTFLDCITTAQLKTIWAPEAEGKVTKWNQVDPSWPATDIKLYGPGTDSGTFDYFTEAINGKAKASRADYTASEDDNVLVQGVAGDEGALGYFGMAYLEENLDKLKDVKVDSGKGCVAPSKETVLSGEYAPLSRPLFVYADAKTLPTDELTKAFLKFYIANAAETANRVGYVPSPDATYAKDSQTLESMQ
jgi:phosphate transport system substrate-binding protein